MRSRALLTAFALSLVGAVARCSCEGGSGGLGRSDAEAERDAIVSLSDAGSEAIDGGPDAASGSGDAGVRADVADWPDDACVAACQGHWVPVGMVAPEYPAFTVTPGAIVAYEPGAERMIVAGAPADVIWQLPLTDATDRFAMLAVSGDDPVLPELIGGDFDSLRRQMLIANQGRDHLELHVLDLAATPSWSAVPNTVFTGAPHVLPLLYDPIGDRHIAIHQGRVYTASAGSSALEWREAGVGRAMPFGNQSAHVFDTRRQRILSLSAPDGGAYAFSFAPPAGWTPLPALPATDDLISASAVYDPDGDRFVALWNGSEVWSLPLSGTGTAAWVKVTASGALPRRSAHAAVYDRDRRRMLVFGGLPLDAAGNFGTTPLSDVWSLTLTGTAAWSQIVPSTSFPHSIFWHAATYDSRRDQIVDLPGRHGGATGPILMDRMEVWRSGLSSGSGWELASISAMPAGGQWQSFVYQPSRDRFVEFCTDVAGNKPWAFDPVTATWTELLPNGTGPHFGNVLPALFVPAPDRMVIWGGDRLYELTLDDSPAWTEHPIPAHGYVVTTMPDRQGFIATSTAGTSFLRLDREPLQWIDVPTTGEGYSGGGGFGYDPAWHALVGADVSPHASLSNVCPNHVDDVWLLPLDISPSRWRRVATGKPVPFEDDPGFSAVSTPSGAVFFGYAGIWRLSIDRCL